ncbi:hypothetical protein F5879DRAFT_812906, partial [Lentinula edodes]
QIFCHLDPGDLLRLSRASKGLRNILLSKTSESIWRFTRQNFIGGLPALPMDLNEPQYARLFFDMSCYVRRFTDEPYIFLSGILDTGL